MGIKRVLIGLLLLISFNGYSQSFYNLGIRNNLTVDNYVEIDGTIQLNDSTVTDWYSGILVNTDFVANSIKDSIAQYSFFSAGTANQIPYMNATGTDLAYSDGLKFDGNTLALEADSGNNNIFINTFLKTPSGDNNIFLGNIIQSGIRLANTGNNNLVLGNNSGLDLTSGSNNVVLGNNSGVNLTIGERNIFIGDSSGYNETGSNKLYIENSNSATPLIYGEFDNDLVKINGDFKVQDDTLEVTADTTYIRNKLKVTGGAIYLDGRTITPATASAYIETGDEAATTISIADTYYFLKGTFTNKDAYNFAFDGDTLQYVGSDSINVILFYSCTFRVGQVNTKVTTGVSINDVIAPQSVMERSISATTDRGSWSGLATLVLRHNDKIKLVVKADKTGTVTAYRFSTIIKN